jgi:hypothetical protein
VGPRASLDAMEKRKILLLLGFEPKINLTKNMCIFYVRLEASIMDKCTIIFSEDHQYVRVGFITNILKISC